jgi:gas vesicle structural protein
VVRVTSVAETSSGVQRPSSSSLADVVDTILDKGLVLDAYVRVSLVGIELVTIDARIVVASVDTYLRYAEAVNRVDLGHASDKGLPDLLQDVGDAGGAVQGLTKGVTKGVQGVTKGVKGAAKDVLDTAGETIPSLTDGHEQERAERFPDRDRQNEG